MLGSESVHSGMQMNCLSGMTRQDRVYGEEEMKELVLTLLMSLTLVLLIGYVALQAVL